MCSCAYSMCAFTFGSWSREPRTDEPDDSLRVREQKNTPPSSAFAYRNQPTQKTWTKKKTTHTSIHLKIVDVFFLFTYYMHTHTHWITLIIRRRRRHTTRNVTKMVRQQTTRNRRIHKKCVRRTGLMPVGFVGFAVVALSFFFWSWSV